MYPLYSNIGCKLSVQFIYGILFKKGTVKISHINISEINEKIFVPVTVGLKSFKDMGNSKIIVIIYENM